MKNILITIAEDRDFTTETTLGIKYSVDEHDCLYFASSLQHLGHQVYLANWMDFNEREFSRMFSFNNSKFIEPIAVQELDLIFVYKMEGFLSSISRFYNMLDRFAATQVINNVSTIRHNIDKSYLWELSQRGVRTIQSYGIKEADERLAAAEKLVVKPLKGERGYGIFIANCPSDLDCVRGREKEWFAQAYMPTIRNGERSLVFLGEEYQHAVVKFPAKNGAEFRCNMSLGGSVAVYQPTADELSFARTVLATYRGMGYPVHFSRIDLVCTSEGPVLMEAELLNPSVYANYSNRGREFGERFAAYLHEFMLRA